MNILITGGLGYIGSSLVNHLSGLGYNITVIDNLYTQRYCSLFNRKHLFSFIEDDFDNLSIEFLKNFDIVIHLAAIVDAANSNNQQEIIEKVNINDTIAFLYKCRQAKCKFIFPSSTSVYGVSTGIVYEDNPEYLNPQSPYAKSKIEIENIIKELIDLEYIILRLGTVCGVSPGIRFQTAINKFCYQAVFNHPLTIWKQNLNLVRPYLSLSDITNIIEKVIYRWNDFQNQTFNILTQNFSLLQIIQKIQQYKPNININYTDCPLLNQYSYEVSTRKIQKLGVKFNGNIDNDIKQTIGIFTK